MGFLRVYQD